MKLLKSMRVAFQRKNILNKTILTKNLDIHHSQVILFSGGFLSLFMETVMEELRKLTSILVRKALDYTFILAEKAFSSILGSFTSGTIANWQKILIAGMVVIVIAVILRLWYKIILTIGIILVMLGLVGMFLAGI